MAPPKLPEPGHQFDLMLPSPDPRIDFPVSFTLLRPNETYGFSTALDLTNIFRLLPPQSIVSLHLAMLHEHQIVIVGSDASIVSDVSIGLVTMMTPFEWEHIFIPVLPASMVEYLGTPVPYVMGITKQNASGYESLLYGLIVVDVDVGEVFFPDMKKVPSNADGQMYLNLKHGTQPFTLNRRMFLSKPPSNVSHSAFPISKQLTKDFEQLVSAMNAKTIHHAVFSMKVLARISVFHAALIQSLKSPEVVMKGLINIELFQTLADSSLQPFLAMFVETSICQEYFERYSFIYKENQRREKRQASESFKHMSQHLLMEQMKNHSSMQGKGPQREAHRISVRRRTAVNMLKTTSIWERIAVFEKKDVAVAQAPRNPNPTPLTTDSPLKPIQLPNAGSNTPMIERSSDFRMILSSFENHLKHHPNPGVPKILTQTPQTRPPPKKTPPIPPDSRDERAVRPATIDLTSLALAACTQLEDDDDPEEIMRIPITPAHRNLHRLFERTVSALRKQNTQPIEDSLLGLIHDPSIIFN
ncbi:putative DENN (AEX-3) domain containing protein [Blattamonas nauphoetae]|uniref:DENN (AEX-3) domain containing protein n=1 Tax=Blattamonas nauphoetae TaxID=2049346 RepID=A0ABQ9X9W3_9EUKA|nr:putative DENN (AEX-3) domain containing protein [Blattamonas nauphoetae]